jgi:glyoxylate carboligase
LVEALKVSSAGEFVEVLTKQFRAEYQKLKDEHSNDCAITRQKFDEAVAAKVSEQWKTLHFLSCASSGKLGSNMPATIGLCTECGKTKAELQNTRALYGELSKSLTSTGPYPHCKFARHKYQHAINQGTLMKT